MSSKCGAFSRNSRRAFRFEMKVRRRTTTGSTVRRAKLGRVNRDQALQYRDPTTPHNSCQMSTLHMPRRTLGWWDRQCPPNRPEGHRRQHTWSPWQGFRCWLAKGLGSGGSNGDNTPRSKPRCWYPASRGCQQASARQRLQDTSYGISATTDKGTKGQTREGTGTFSLSSSVSSVGVSCCLSGLISRISVSAN